MSADRTWFIRATAFALGGGLAVAASVPAAAQMTREQKIAMMDSIAESPVIENRVAGVAVAVVQGSDTLLLESYGQADLEWDVPMAEDAVFEIGSVTKQFTAAAILKLRDEGKVDLDADLTTYLPDYPTQGRRIPVRLLLNHTSGIKGYTEMESFGEIAQRDLPPDSLVARFAAEPFDFEPGEALIYNNSAFFLLGLIIEKVSGKSYEAYVEEALFAPLGMERSMYCSNSEVVERRAHGYQLTPNGLVRKQYIDHTWPYSAGSLCSSAGDLITWLRALHGGKVLPDASYRDMITPGTLKDGTPVRYAMGIGVVPDARGRPMISHGGGIPGFVSETRYYPAEDLYVVVLFNTTGNASPNAFAQEIVDVLLPRQQAAVRRPFEGDTAPLVGTYTGPTRGRASSTVNVTATANGIAVAINGGTAQPLSWVEGWTFSAGSQIVTFKRDGDSGPATTVYLDGGGSVYVMRRQ